MDQKLKDTGENLFAMTMALHSKLVNPHAISKSCEVPQSHIKVLFVLKNRGPVAMSDMAKRLSISKPNLTPIIDKLIADEHVERTANPKDRRILLISLTEKGKAYLESLHEHVKEHSREKLKGLPPEDVDTLLECSARILAVLQKL